MVHSLYRIAKGWSRGEIFQSGLTRSTLCASCNNFCGKQYVRPFAEWTLQAARYHLRMGSDTRVLLPFTICPLAIAKHLAVMALAMADAESIDLPHFLDLRHFVGSPVRRGGIDTFRATSVQ